MSKLLAASRSRCRSGPNAQQPRGRGGGGRGGQKRRQDDALLLPRSPQRFGAEARRSLPLSRRRGRDALSTPLSAGAEASRQPADAGVIQLKFGAVRGTPGVSCSGIMCCSLRASGLRRFRFSGARKTGFPFPDKQSSGPVFHLHLIEHPQVHTPCKNTTRRYFRSWNERAQLKKLMAYQRSEYVEERDRATSNHSLPRLRSSRDSPGENEAELRRFGSIRKSRIQPDFIGGSCRRSQPPPCLLPGSLGFVSPPLGAPPLLRDQLHHPAALTSLKAPTPN